MQKAPTGLRLLTLFLITILLSGVLPIHAQSTHPVSVNIYLAPPYSNYLSDYYTTGKEKMVVTLLNRDRQRPTLDVRLRVSITAVNGLKIQNKEEINYPPITLDAGIPRRLSQEDLAPYLQPRNINTQGTLNQGKLPEGLIEFTVQAIETRTRKIVSAPATGRVWLTSQKPPILRLPANNENISFRDPLNLKFQWEPLHKNISQVEYEFELRELPDNGASPQSTYPYAPLIYQERQVHTYLMYTPLMPPLSPDKTYAWRVRAIAKDGVDDLNMFVNNGYSEIHSLRTTTNCHPPANTIATLKDRSLTLNWTPAINNNRYTIQYRLKNDVSSEWKEGTTPNPQLTLYDLKRGATYQYRIGSICTIGDPVYTPASEITIPAVDSARLAHCGIPGTFNLDNKEPIETLSPGDIVMANDYPMTLTAVSGGNGSFTGEGWIPVNWLFETKWAVEFDNIRVNTDKQLIAGSIRAKYDQTESQIAQSDEITQGGHENTRQGITIPDITLDITIPPNPVFRYNPETEELSIFSTDGKEIAKINVKNEGKDIFPITIKDKDGNIYQIDAQKDEDGNTALDQDGNPNLSSTHLGKQQKPLPDNSFNPQALSDQTAIVTFEKGTGTYALDKWRPEYKEIVKIRKEYDRIGENYYTSWKYLPVGGSDKILANVEIANNNPANIIPDSIIFATPQGLRFTSKPLGNNRYELTPVGGQAKDIQEIFALYPEKGSSSKFFTLGKLNVVSYEKQTQNLVMVQVGATINGYSLENRLNEIYNPVGIHWKVTTQKFEYPEQDLKNFIEENSGLLSAYNDKMNALIAAYKDKEQIDGKTSYIFVLRENGVSPQNTDKRDVQAIMPRGKQFGFIFTNHITANETDYIIAHELGHGRWRLQHTFDKTYGEKMAKYTTDNLMDYANPSKSNDYKNKIHLAKWQWEQLNDPAWFTNPLEGDQKGMWTTDGHYYTLRLLALLMGFDDAMAIKLGKYSEYPDSDVFSNKNMEERDTWMIGGQQQLFHALTGKYHGVELAATAYALTKTHTDDNSLKYLLHRFGDVFAHFNTSHDKNKLSNFNIAEYIRAIDKYIDDKFITNYDFSRDNNRGIDYSKPPYGEKILTRFSREEVAKQLIDLILAGLNGNSLGGRLYFYTVHEELLKYLPMATQNIFKMYGSGDKMACFTIGHSLDGGGPDIIMERKELYMKYIDGLIQVLALKYNKNISQLEILKIKAKFERILREASLADISTRLDAVLTYETFRLKYPGRNKVEFVIPVKYAVDAHLSWKGKIYFKKMKMEDNFLSDALAITDNMKKYMEASIHANSHVDVTLMKLNSSENNTKEDIYYYNVEVIINTKLSKD